jgi:hypothetical protein
VSKFEPWNTFRELGNELAKQMNNMGWINIEEPPCKECIYFKPKILINNAQFDGVRLCHSKEMHNDFSCYEEKPPRSSTAILGGNV